MIYKTVCRRTQKALGFPVNLHRFRHAAATFWSVRDPVNVRGVKDLLGHATFATTEQHYIMAQSRMAGRALARAIEDLEAAAANVTIRILCTERTSQFSFGHSVILRQSHQLQPPPGPLSLEPMLVPPLRDWAMM